MRLFAEDEALPVDPGIEVIARAVDEELEAHLRVLREVDFGVHQRLYEAVVGAAIDIAEHESDVAQLSLRPQER